MFYMNWNPNKFKADAKITLKKNYWTLLIVCVLLMLIAGDFQGTKAEFSISKTSETEETEISRLNGNSNSKALSKFLTEYERADRAKDDAINKIESYRPTRGVLAKVFNSATGVGGFSTGVLNSANQFFFKGRIDSGSIIILANILKLLFFIFISQVLLVGGRRVFLESRRYDKTEAERILFPFQIRRMKKVELVMFRKTIYEFLWLFTIVGFFIKRYSYALVPFIVAENPDINGKTAIKLSRNMMKGYKVKLFALEISFLGWNLLSAITFGLVGIFYLNPYQTATLSEVYMTLRRRAKFYNLPLSEYMNDSLLDPAVSTDATYPVQQFPIQAPASRKWITIDYKKTYSLQHLILLFFIYAFIGWSWEVSLHLLSDGVFVNRGVLFGPWLPIYGCGATLVIMLLKPFRDNRLLTFLLSLLICGVVEYCTSAFLEYALGMKWWDYSGYFLNINGRICMEGLLTFGLGCYAIIYIVTPLLDNLLYKIPARIAWCIAAILILFFVSDLIYSRMHPNTGKGITDYQSQKITGTLLCRHKTHDLLT